AFAFFFLPRALPLALALAFGLAFFRAIGLGFDAFGAGLAAGFGGAAGAAGIGGAMGAGVGVQGSGSPNIRSIVSSIFHSRASAGRAPAPRRPVARTTCGRSVGSCLNYPAVERLTSARRNTTALRA